MSNPQIKEINNEIVPETDRVVAEFPPSLKQSAMIRAKTLNLTLTSYLIMLVRTDIGQDNVYPLRNETKAS